MSYLTVYQTKFIPKASLSILYKQKRAFERPRGQEVAIYEAICERIYELEIIESIKTPML